MFNKLKNYLVRKGVERQLKNVSPDQKDMIMGAVEKNPELFQKISKEIDEKTKQGKGQMAASIEVMKKYQNELREVMNR